MKNILHVFRNLKYGGNQALSYNLVKYSSREFSHSILCFQDDLEMKAEFEEIGCSITVIDIDTISVESAKKEFYKHISCCKINTVVTWFYPFILQFEEKNVNVNFIHHIGTAPTFRPYKKWFRGLFFVWRYRKSRSVFLFASKYIKKQNKKVFGVCFTNNHVVYNAVNTQRFTVHYNGKASGFTIVMVGRMDGSKDFDTLIKIAPLLNKEIRNLTIKIVGDGVDKDRLTKLSSSLNVDSVIEFTGRIKDVPKVLAESNLCVFLNKPLEGFGLAIVEAMSCGLPVVTYNFGANTEILENGVQGYLVSSEKTLIDKIIKIYKNPVVAERLSKNARATVEARFSIERFVKEYEEKY